MIALLCWKAVELSYIKLYQIITSDGSWTTSTSSNAQLALCRRGFVNGDYGWLKLRMFAILTYSKSHRLLENVAEKTLERLKNNYNENQCWQRDKRQMSHHSVIAMCWFQNLSIIFLTLESFSGVVLRAQQALQDDHVIVVIAVHMAENNGGSTSYTLPLWYTFIVKMIAITRWKQSPPALPRRLLFAARHKACGRFTTKCGCIPDSSMLLEETKSLGWGKPDLDNQVTFAEGNTKCA